MKKFISFSGGVESSTMCLLYGGDADAIFCDTGFEHKEIYERLDHVENEVRKIHPNFKVIRVKNEKHGSLKDYIKKQKFYPSPMARFCTRMFKIEPIDNFLKSQGNCKILIGLNIDEKHRTGNHGLMKNVSYDYPLIDDDLTRDNCIRILKEHDLNPSFPPYMQRGGCIGCFYKSKGEFIAMSIMNPEEFAVVEEIEKSIQDKRGKFFGIRDGIPSLKALREKEHNALFSVDELYDVYQYEMNSNRSCGVFCNR